MGEKKKKGSIAFFREFAGVHKVLAFMGIALSSVSMLLSMASHVCVWLAIRELLAAAPLFLQAADAMRYGWLAFAFGFAETIIYFAGLICLPGGVPHSVKHKKAGSSRLMQAPLGFLATMCRG